jgi:hypothetical protein
METTIEWHDDKDKRKVVLTLTWQEAWDLASPTMGNDLPDVAEELADALEDAATEPWTYEMYAELVISGHLVVTDPQTGNRLIPGNEAALRQAFAMFERGV